MNRREFVAGVGMLASASLLATGVTPLSAAVEHLPDTHLPPAAASETGPRRIDIHHHIIPSALRQAWTSAGVLAYAGQAVPDWSAEQSLAMMDEHGISSAITSVPAPAVYFGDEGAAAALARTCNEQAAELGQRYPGRFGSFAVLPLPSTEWACAEAEYALDVLKADGVMLLGSSAGAFLGDPRFESLMAVLDQRKARVFVQPNLHDSSTKLELGTPGFLLETVCDITRAAVNLIFTGTMERYPNIRWILANGGGFLPYAAWRISLGNALPEFGDTVPQGAMTYLRRFYFDTSMVASNPCQAVLKELVDPTQILFGSGYPYVSTDLVGSQLKTLEASTVWGPATRTALSRNHALSLFPHLAQRGELVAAAQNYEMESSMQWLGRTLKKPISALAQHLKD